ncbi:unnamed protein product [Amoebophrya sp. A120]|nr:unnamed protein product [Amoebophrya sp. A120]|eukprot:GSA120T00018470001.1
MATAVPAPIPDRENMSLVQRMRMLTEEMRKNSEKIESLQQEIQFAHRARDVLLKQIDLGQKVASAITAAEEKSKQNNENADDPLPEEGIELEGEDAEAINDLQKQLANTELELATINIEKSLVMGDTTNLAGDDGGSSSYGGKKETTLLPIDRCLKSDRTTYAVPMDFPNSDERHYVFDGPLVVADNRTADEASFQASYPAAVTTLSMPRKLTGPTNNPKPGSFAAKTVESAVFGFGCFWCAESRFWHLPGVVSTQAGYCGGPTAFPTYSEVCRGVTNHAEVVRVQFQPSKISYREILRHFWIAHDPTKYCQQGNDSGSQYRSIIVYYNENQKQIAEETKAAFAKAVRKQFPEKYPASMDEDSIVRTEIVDGDQNVFYLAERKHQQYEAKPYAREYCGLRPLPIPLGLLQDI